MASFWCKFPRSSGIGWRSACLRLPLKRNRPTCVSLYSTTAVKSEPLSETPLQTPLDKEFAPKIKNLVQEISQLNLLEVAELNQLLKKRLNIADAPMMSMGSMPMTSARAPVEEEEEAPQQLKTSFTVKLMKYDDTKKVPLIKEIKGIMEGMNLVQAKKFVESVPQVLKANISKDEAEKLQKAMEALGASCEIE